jgi:tetratricopeptide (TPR) repeat protein
MPGRFSNLEFEEEHNESHEALAGLQSRRKDAGDFLAQAEAEYRWGRFEEALRLYTRALQEDRTTVPAWVGQVQMLVQLDECHEARVWSDKALELFRGNGELLAAKAQACARLNDNRSCLASSDASLRAPGSSPWRWIVRGEALLAKGERHFEECFQRALTDPAADWFDRVVIARVYAFYHRMTNALGYLKEAIEIEPGHGYTWFMMGKCQQALSLETAAQTSYERCLELRPDYREAQSAMFEVHGGRSILERLGGVWRRWRGR